MHKTEIAPLTGAIIPSESFGVALRIHYATFFSLMGGWIFDALDATIYAYDVPGIMADMKVSLAQAFSVVSVFFLCAAIGGVAMGSLCDKIGRKPVVMLSIALYGIFNFLCGTAHSIGGLYLYRGLVGLSLGGLWPATMSLLSEIWPAKTRGAAVGILHSGWSIGMFISAAFAYFLIPIYGWRGMFFATAVPAILTFFAITFFAKESPVWLESRKLKKQAPASTRDTMPLVKLLNKKNLKTAMLGLGVSAFGQFGWWVLFTFLPTYMDRTLKLGITKGAEFMIWTSIGALAGYCSFGYLSDLYGRRIVFASFCIGMALMIPVFIFSVTHSGLAYLPFVGLVLGYSTGYYGGYGALYAEMFATDIRATGISFCQNMGRLAIFAGPLLIPYLIPRIGFKQSIGVASLSLVIAAVLVMLLKETKGINITAQDAG
jgi:MFS family permease